MPFYALPKLSDAFKLFLPVILKRIVINFCELMLHLRLQTKHLFDCRVYRITAPIT